MSEDNRIHASYTDSTIRVYQAYRGEIACPALSAQKFVPPFSMSRMTWIKPSFFWMMHRSGWGKKPDQDFVLAIDITRAGFEWALSNAALSSFAPTIHSNHQDWQRQLDERPIRIQWDPDRDAGLNRLEHRAIQIGLRGEAVELYVNEWIQGIEDVTALAHQIHDLSSSGHDKKALDLAPVEQLYPAEGETFPHIGLAGGEPHN